MVVDLQSSKEKNEQLESKIRETEMVGKLYGSEENSGLKRVKKKIEGGKNKLHKMITMRKKLADNIAQFSTNVQPKIKLLMIEKPIMGKY